MTIRPGPSRPSSYVEVPEPPLRAPLAPLPRCQPATLAKVRAGTWPYDEFQRRSALAPPTVQPHHTLEGSKMSSWGVSTREPEAPVRRVRDEVKDGAAVVITSAVTSTLLAVCVLLLTKLAG